MFVHRHAKVTAEQSPDQLRGEKMGDCCPMTAAPHCIAVDGDLSRVPVQLIAERIGRKARDVSLV
jgi:hypothetical protein